MGYNSFVRKGFIPIFLAGVFLSLHYAAVVYINSSFLENFFSLSTVGRLFILGAVVSLLTFIEAPRILAYLGGKRFFFLLLLFEILASVAFITTKGPVLASTAFLIYSATVPLLYYLLDVFLEEISKDKITGEIRGIYLTLVNAAIAGGPLIIANVLSDDNFAIIYSISFFIILPVFILAAFITTKHRGNVYRERSELPLRKWYANKNLRHVTYARTILNIFYAVMIIFIPPFLRFTLNFEWSELGIMFTIMLLPFVVLEWPVGELADRYVGEKELMTLGFFLTGTAVLIMPFLKASFLLWTSVLLLSRIGASIIEITTESYFFKKIDGHDDALISIFRLTSPTGIIVGSTIGILATSYFAFPVLLFALSGVVLLGMRESALLRDTL